MFMTLAEAAEFLRISRNTLYCWVRQHRIPYRKHGSRVVFVRAELERWSESQRVEIQAEAWLRPAPGGKSAKTRHGSGSLTTQRKPESRVISNLE